MAAQGIVRTFDGDEVVHRDQVGGRVEVALPDGHDPADYGRVTLQAIIHARAREVGVSLFGDHS